jgi:hypothetical protein
MVAGALLLEVQKVGRPAKPAENADGKIVTSVTDLTQGQAGEAAGVSRKVMNEAARVLTGVHMRNTPEEELPWRTAGTVGYYGQQIRGNGVSIRAPCGTERTWSVTGST